MSKKPNLVQCLYNPKKGQHCLDCSMDLQFALNARCVETLSLMAGDLPDKSWGIMPTEACIDLVRLGFARRQGESVYYITHQGLAFLEALENIDKTFVGVGTWSHS